MIKKLISVFSAGLLAISVVGLSAVADNRATLSKIEKTVELKYGTSLWRAGSVNQMVRPGTSLRTGALSKAEVLYPDGTLTRLGSRTSITVLEKEGREVKIDQGRFWFKVVKNTGGMKIHAPGAVAAITGTEGIAVFNDGTEQEGYLKNNIFAALGGYRIAQNENSGFSVGLTDGSAEMFQTDENGNPIGDGIPIGPGDMVTFNQNGFSRQNFDINQFRQQNADISGPDSFPDSNGNSNNQNSNQNNNNNNGSNTPGDNLNNSGNNNQGGNNGNSPSNLNLGPNNPTTEQIPNNLNDTQNPELSPTTGSLEIIIE